MDPNRPACMRAWQPTITFSSADMVENRRMFWNVRAMPAEVIRSGRRPVTSWPSNRMRPAVGL